MTKSSFQVNFPNEMLYRKALFLLFIVTLVGCALFDREERSLTQPESLAKFFEDNGYNLIYPLDSTPEPGAIYEETEEKGLYRLRASKDSCAKDLEPKQGFITFGSRTATSEYAIEFLIGLSQQLAPVKASLEGAFQKKASYTVISEPMPTLEEDWLTLRNIYTRAIDQSGDCLDALQLQNSVILSKVASVKKFTFQFKGLKSGGVGVILEKLLNANLTANKTGEDTIVIEYDTPMKLCYQRYTSAELRIIGRDIKEKGVVPLDQQTKGPLPWEFTPRSNDFTSQFFRIEE